MANCRNTQQLNITCGTDVVLHDKLMFDGEVFDPNVSVDIECNLVNSLGKRTSLEYEIADETLIIQIPWVDGRNAGCYGLEVKGKCNGKTWATYADSLIRYTRATVEGAAVVETEHDWYDVTQVVSYRYSDSPLDEVDATIDDKYGEPMVTTTYEHNKLTLDFKNLRGNGIVSVEQTVESTEPEGVNETTITQDNGNTTVIRVRNGKSIVGPQGIPGEGAIWTGQGEEIMTLAQTTGQAINKSMSQKAVTNEIIKSTKYDNAIIDISELTRYAYYVYNNKWTAASGATAARRVIMLPITAGKTYAVKNVNSISANYSVFTTDSISSGATASYATGWSWSGTSTEFMFVAPADATHLCLQVHNNDTEIPWLVREVIASAYAEEFGEGRFIGVSQKFFTDEVLYRAPKTEEIDYSNTPSTGGYSIVNRKWKWVNGRKGRWVPVYGGTAVRVTGNVSRGTYFAFVSQLDTVADATVSFATGEVDKRTVAAGQTVVCAMPLDTRYLFVCTSWEGDADNSAAPTIETLSATDYAKYANDVTQSSEIGFTKGKRFYQYGEERSETDWCITDKIPLEVGQNTIACAFGKCVADIACICMYTPGGDCYGWYSTNTTGVVIHREVTINTSADGYYIRFCYYEPGEYTGFLAINGKVVWTPTTLGKGIAPSDEKMFNETSTIKEGSLVGKGSAFVSYSFFGLISGNRYRLVIDDTTPFDSYKSSLTSGQTRLYFQTRKDGALLHTIYSAPSSMPIPQSLDFIAEDCDYYTFGIRATTGTVCKFKLIGIFDDNTELREESSLIRNAKYTNNEITLLGLLHYSDLHGDSNAANEILQAAARYSGYIDDLLSTGDMVLENADGSATYPQGTTWWQGCGLPEKSLFVLGNHDNATASATEYDQKENSNAWDGKGIDYAVAQYFSPYDSGFGDNYHRPEGKCYWYKDYPTQKVRLIGLDCMHRFDGIVDPENGEQDGSNAGLKHLTTEQEEWLVARLNETLDSNDGAYQYHVVVACHYPLDDYDETTNGKNKEWDDTTHEFICNHKSTGGRVVCYKTGDVSNWSYYGRTVLEQEAKFSLRNRVNNGYPSRSWPNYTKGNFNNFGEIIKSWMTRGGKFVAYLCGHRHTDAFYYPTNFPDILCISINQAGALTTNPGEHAWRMFNGNERCCANYITVDTRLGRLKIVRIGMKRGVYLAAQNYLLYDYVNKKVINEG